jgi:hypothetical protein
MFVSLVLRPQSASKEDAAIHGDRGSCNGCRQRRVAQRCDQMSICIDALFLPRQIITNLCQISYLQRLTEYGSIFPNKNLGKNQIVRMRARGGVQYIDSQKGPKATTHGPSDLTG